MGLGQIEHKLLMHHHLIYLLSSGIICMSLHIALHQNMRDQRILADCDIGNDQQQKQFSENSCTAMWANATLIPDDDMCIGCMVDKYTFTLPEAVYGKLKRKPFHYHHFIRDPFLMPTQKCTFRIPRIFHH